MTSNYPITGVRVVIVHGVLTNLCNLQKHPAVYASEVVGQSYSSVNLITNDEYKGILSCSQT